LIIENLRADQINDTKRDLGSQIIKDKNKEFQLIESMCYIKLLDLYFKAKSDRERYECIEAMKMLVIDRNRYIQIHARNPSQDRISPDRNLGGDFTDEVYASD